MKTPVATIPFSFWHGISPEDVELASSSDHTDLLLTVNSTGEVITISDFFFDRKYEIDSVEFTDGTVWSSSLIKAWVSVPTEGADVLLGTEGNDHLIALGGNDYVYGGAGDDVLQGGEGEDNLYGEDGNDLLTGNGRLEGGEGNDTLRAGDGDAMLIGGSGNDVYEYGPGDGNATIYADEQDILRFLAGISSADISLSRETENWNTDYNYASNNLLIGINSTGKTLTLAAFFDDISDNSIRAIEFDDGEVWSIDDIRSLLSQGTEGGDHLYNYQDESRGGYAENYALTLDGQGGDDRLYGGHSGETFFGGSGHDWIYGAYGNDTLSGGDGNDRLYGEIGDDILYGGTW